MQKLDDDELVELQLNANDWYVRHARRILQERGAEADAGARASWPTMAFDTSPTKRAALRALWALHVTGGLDEDAGAARPGERQRRTCAPGRFNWHAKIAQQRVAAMLRAIRCAGRKTILAGRAAVSGLGRCSGLPLDERWAILPGLLAHAEDADDHNLPLMVLVCRRAAGRRDAGAGPEPGRPTARFRWSFAFMVRRDRQDRHARGARLS